LCRSSFLAIKLFFRPFLLDELVVHVTAPVLGVTCDYLCKQLCVRIREGNFGCFVSGSSGFGEYTCSESETDGIPLEWNDSRPLVMVLLHSLGYQLLNKSSFS
jgi:hypothetical protein